MTSLLSRADLAPTLNRLADARTLPGAVYTSPEILALEQAGVFGRQWLCAGRAADLPDPGDFLTVEVAGDSVLIVRGADGGLRAFFNVCRHRGSRLVDAPAGKGLARILCPYHAWAYGLDGSLQQVPRQGGDYPRSELALVPVGLGEYHGFIFINVDARARPLGEALADLPDLSRFRMRELVLGRRIVYEVNANWKLICENYSECYHCPGAHPQLARISDHIARSTRPMEVGRSFNGGPMRLKDGVETMSMSGRRTIPVIPGLSDDDHRHVYYYVLYPNFLLSPHPDYVLTHTVWPLAPDRSRVICEFLFTAEAVARPAEQLDDMVDFWDVTNRQDWALCERAQAGTASRGYRPGPYQPTEDCVHTFDQWYAAALSPLLPA